MNRFKVLAVLLWKGWFVLLNGLVILSMLPLLFASSIRERDYPWFYRLSRIWARIVLAGMGWRLRPEFSPAAREKRPWVVVANHSSMIDILCTLILVPAPFLFIGKTELAKIPLFGFFYRRTNILVDRSSLASKHRSFLEADRRLSQGLGVCVYPEGGVPEPEIHLAPFKDGAFRLAVRNGLPILPITFADNKKAFPYALFEGRPMRLRARVGEPQWPLGTDAAAVSELRLRVRKIIEQNLNELQ